MISFLNTNNLYRNILLRDFTSISYTISIIESSHNRINVAKKILFFTIVKHAKNKKQRIFVLGITGSTGAGKSTFINKLSNYISSNFYQKIAILTIDPTSPISKGCIMGDIIRMEKIYNNKNVYTRATKTDTPYLSIPLLTNDIIFLFIASSFDTVIVETVGIGQTDIDIYSLVDILCLVLQPIEGDEIQSIKKGILEIVDIILVNKFDGKTMCISSKTREFYTSSIFQSNAKQIFNISGLKNTGICKTWRVAKNIYYKNSYKKNQSFSNFIKKIISIYLVNEFFNIYKNNIWYKRERILLLFRKKSILQLIYDFKNFIR